MIMIKLYINKSHEYPIIINNKIVAPLYLYISRDMNVTAVNIQGLKAMSSLSKRNNVETAQIIELYKNRKSNVLIHRDI